jgi:hypothetical protein
LSLAVGSDPHLTSMHQDRARSPASKTSMHGHRAGAGLLATLYAPASRARSSPAAANSSASRARSSPAAANSPASRTRQTARGPFLPASRTRRTAHALERAELSHAQDRSRPRARRALARASPLAASLHERLARSGPPGLAVHEHLLGSTLAIAPGARGCHPVPWPAPLCEGHTTPCHRRFTGIALAVPVRCFDARTAAHFPLRGSLVLLRARGAREPENRTR